MFTFWQRTPTDHPPRKTVAQRRCECSARSGDRRRRLICEALEDRRLLAAVTVDTTTDTSNDGDTSSIAAYDWPAEERTARSRCAEAILAANNTAGADTISFDTSGVFAAPQTITLGGTPTADHHRRRDHHRHRRDEPDDRRQPPVADFQPRRRQ